MLTNLAHVNTIFIETLKKNVDILRYHVGRKMTNFNGGGGLDSLKNSSNEQGWYFYNQRCRKFNLSFEFCVSGGQRNYLKGISNLNLF